METNIGRMNPSANPKKDGGQRRIEISLSELRAAGANIPEDPKIHLKV